MLAMIIRAVLLDLGNTLVHYYRGPEFRAILRRCLERTALVLGTTVSDELYEHALVLNREDSGLAVRPLLDRIGSLLEPLKMTVQPTSVGSLWHRSSIVLELIVKRWRCSTNYADAVSKQQLFPIRRGVLRQSFGGVGAS